MLTLKKSLGQHFLVDDSISKTITEILQERALHNLLEVGPGGGALTKHLLTIPGINLKCVEIDNEKVNYLKRAFPALKQSIIHDDILSIGPPFEGRFTLVGNFPYNISTQIVFRVIEWKAVIETMIGMFQKEVAERLAAKEGSKVYGVTSVLVQAFFNVEYLFEVSETAFDPPPKVKSAVIRFTPRLDVPEMKSEAALSTLVKTAFGQRRKTLRNATRSIFMPEVIKDELFNKRAEELSVNQFAELTFRMGNSGGVERSKDI